MASGFVHGLPACPCVRSMADRVMTTVERASMATRRLPEVALRPAHGELQARVEPGGVQPGLPESPCALPSSHRDPLEGSDRSIGPRQAIHAW